MSITYPDHIASDRPLAGNTVGTASVAESVPYTPVYARSGKARNGRKAVRTWMILAPIGALVLIGGGVAISMGGEASAPLGAPVPVETLPPARPVAPEAAPMAAPTPAVAAAATQAAPVPVARPAVETRSRAAVVRPRVVAEPVVAAVEPAPPPAGPQPYLAAAEPAATAAPAPSTPVLPPETVTGSPID